VGKNFLVADRCRDFDMLKRKQNFVGVPLQWTTVKSSRIRCLGGILKVCSLPTFRRVGKLRNLIKQQPELRRQIGIPVKTYLTGRFYLAQLFFQQPFVDI
jgi:hypothetical protein